MVAFERRGCYQATREDQIKDTIELHNEILVNKSQDISASAASVLTTTV